MRNHVLSSVLLFVFFNVRYTYKVLTNTKLKCLLTIGKLLKTIEWELNVGVGTVYKALKQDDDIGILGGDLECYARLYSV